VSHVAHPCGDEYNLIRLAEFLLRDRAEAEEVVRAVLESPQQDDAARRRRLVSRCRAIILSRRGDFSGA
jgi:hypothetical protein